MNKMDFGFFLSKVDVWTPEEMKNAVQDYAFAYWNKSHCKGTFEGATGVGKSKVGVTATQQQFHKNPDSIVYVLVPTETLRDKGWPDEFIKWNCGHLIPKINFVCHASMQDIIVNGEVDLVIFDECHHATPINCTFFSNNKVWNVLGLSATLPKGEKDKMDILNKICPSVFQVTLDEATTLKLVSEFEVKVLFFELNSVDLSVIAGTATHPTAITELAHYKSLSKSLGKAIYKKLSEGAKFFWIQKRMSFLKNVKTRELIAKDVMKAIINDTNRTLIFCGSIEQSKNLCGDNVYNSETTDEKLELFRSNKINFLGAVNALNEGQNIPDLDQIFIVCIDSKDRNAIQRIGRSVRWRPGHTAMVVILVAMDTADEKWYRSAFKNFDKKRIKEYKIKPG